MELGKQLSPEVLGRTQKIADSIQNKEGFINRSTDVAGDISYEIPPFLEIKMPGIVNADSQEIGLDQVARLEPFVDSEEYYEAEQEEYIDKLGIRRTRVVIKRKLRSVESRINLSDL